MGCLLGGAGGIADRLTAGGVLALLTFVMAWLMNRRARMRRIMEYRVTRVLAPASDMR